MIKHCNLFLLLIFSLSVSAQKGMNTTKTVTSNMYSYDTTRIYDVMAKARRGEEITLGFIGGSITKGFAASSDSKRWINLVTNWWKTTFPKAKINMINAGIGGTGSNIGAFRVKEDLLSHQPDFVVVEFAVNDSLNDLSTQTMEGLVRQILQDPRHPALMMLCLREEKGKTAQKYHIPVARHYRIPLISFADLIEAQVAKDGVSLHSLFSDGLHPLDPGMKYIAQFINDELSRIYHKLPPDNEMSVVKTKLPNPLTTELFANTTKYNSTTLIAKSNNGWNKSPDSWTAETPGSEITFEVKGSAIAILYSRYNTVNRGMAEVWLDNGKHILLNAHWNDTWGPAIIFKMIGEFLESDKHTLHIKIVKETDEWSNGHFFQLLNVLSAEKTNVKK